MRPLIPGPQFGHFAAGRAVATVDVRGPAEIIQVMPAVPPPIAAAVLRAMPHFDGAGALGNVGVPTLAIGSAVPNNEPADVPEQVNAMMERFVAINHLVGPRPAEAASDLAWRACQRRGGWPIHTATW